MARRVVYSPRAQCRLTGLYDRIAGESGFSEQGWGLRVRTDGSVWRPGRLPYGWSGSRRYPPWPAHHRISPTRWLVIEVLGIYYGGCDYESLLRTCKEW